MEGPPAAAGLLQAGRGARAIVGRDPPAAWESPAPRPTTFVVPTPRGRGRPARTRPWSRSCSGTRRRGWWNLVYGWLASGNLVAAARALPAVVLRGGSNEWQSTRMEAGALLTQERSPETSGETAPSDARRRENSKAPAPFRRCWGSDERARKSAWGRNRTTDTVIFWTVVEALKASTSRRISEDEGRSVAER